MSKIKGGNAKYGYLILIEVTCITENLMREERTRGYQEERDGG